MSERAEKAKQYLKDNGVFDLWQYFEQEDTPKVFEQQKARELIWNLVRWQSWTPKQLDYAKALSKKIVAREKEIAEAEDCPEGKQHIFGKVISVKWQGSAYGSTLKMLVKDFRGFKVWGSVPKALQEIIYMEEAEEEGVLFENKRDVKKGDVVKFDATISLTDDPKFGFFQRPSKAILVDKRV